MKYFFILGNNPTLSVAEILAVFGLNTKDTKCPIGHLVSKDVFILETNQEIDARALIKRLGGTIKIGLIKSKVDKKGKEKLKKEIIKLLKPRPGEPGRGKFKFGFSYYGSAKLNLKPLAMETKKYLREKSISSRWVTSKEKTLSSVVVEQNKLTSKGVEIILIEDKDKILIGQTQVVQPFKDLSFRDYGRPARDDRSGMLPPKLAQIMINLSVSVSTGHCPAPTDKLILDPFCGSGTILTEAMLMGYKNLIGSDISEKAISDTEKNIEWVKRNYELGIPPIRPSDWAGKRAGMNYELHKRNALELSKFIKPDSVDVIVTEPYLGPQRGKLNLQKTIPELEKLYSNSLREFKKILKPGGQIVMIWPVFQKKYHLDLNLSDFRIVDLIPKHLRDNPSINLTNRNTIIYGREGQKVWREVVVLEK